MPGLLAIPLAACYAVFSAVGSHCGCQKAQEKEEDLRFCAAKGAFLGAAVLTGGFTGMMLLGLLAFGIVEGDAFFRVISYAGFFLVLINGGFAALGAFLGAYVGPKTACWGAALMAALGVCLGPW